MIRFYRHCLSFLLGLLIVGALTGGYPAVSPVLADEKAAAAIGCESEAGAALPANTLSESPPGEARPLSVATFSDAAGTVDPAGILAENFLADPCLSSYPVPPPGGALWFRFDVTNPSDLEKRWFVTTMEAIVDDIRLYEQTAAGLTLVSRTGRTTAYLERPAKSGRLAVPLSLEAGSSTTFYLRISGTFAPKTTPILISPGLLADLSKVTNNLFLSIVGFLAIMAVVSLILYRHIAPRFSVYYSSYLASQFALALIYHDWLAQIPFMNLPVTFVARWSVFCGGVGTLILILFCRALLTTGESSKREELLYRALLVVGAVVVLVAVADPWRYSGLLFLLRTLVPLILLALSLRKHRAGLVQARWVAAGLAALVFGIGVGAYGFLSPAAIEPTSSAFDLVFMRPLNMTYFVAVFCEPVFMMIAISAMAAVMQKQRQAAVVEVQALKQNLTSIENEFSEVQKATNARLEALETALANDPEKKEHLSAEQQFLERATECVLDHIGEPGFDVNELAVTLGISQKTLGRRLKDLHGLTPAAFIRSVRLNVARDLILLRRYNTVGEVAFAAGFSSVGHFAKLYRQQFEETPSETLKGLSGG
ncbi:helix-turn-helix domain-containing protein [Denitrobaculum tricleocarpae]|uniref:Helix-turn-helix domain-containing protein n=1 Tax=Denitrobaculum tricleocarpae TaxID=2591009 RepID=A0A545TKU7_9PROT|nr:helix-turn-helix domain-containing protein [Denitrobaculum tricleocarpae]TQV77844.1 helix-turn-helix domain-containing protein [Denitrobaculum tricleocarpae]